MSRLLRLGALDGLGERRDTSFAVFVEHIKQAPLVSYRTWVLVRAVSGSVEVRCARRVVI
jgi:hypothetical protein